MTQDHPRPAGEPLAVVGLVADTHIPDRVRELHPGLIPALRAAQVNHILHAGDISTRRVLDQLGEVAPVTAVRGNRDWLAGPLMVVETLELAGVKVTLLHGHGGWFHYWIDKVQYLLRGYRFERYIRLLLSSNKTADVVVFGHTHHPVVEQRGGKLLVNPGSASFGLREDRRPTFGLLRVFPGRQVSAEIVRLVGYTVSRRAWTPAPFQPVGVD